MFFFLGLSSFFNFSIFFTLYGFLTSTNLLIFDLISKGKLISVSIGSLSAIFLIVSFVFLFRSLHFFARALNQSRIENKQFGLLAGNITKDGEPVFDTKPSFFDKIFDTRKNKNSEVGKIKVVLEELGKFFISYKELIDNSVKSLRSFNKRNAGNRTFDDFMSLFCESFNNPCREINNQLISKKDKFSLISFQYNSFHKIINDNCKSFDDFIKKVTTKKKSFNPDESVRILNELLKSFRSSLLKTEGDIRSGISKRFTSILNTDPPIDEPVFSAI